MATFRLALAVPPEASGMTRLLPEDVELMSVIVGGLRTDGKTVNDTVTFPEKVFRLLRVRAEELEKVVVPTGTNNVDGLAVTLKLGMVTVTLTVMGWMRRGEPPLAFTASPWAPLPVVDVGEIAAWTNRIPPDANATLVAFRTTGKSAGVLLVFRVKVPLNPFRLNRVTLTRPVLPRGTDKVEGGSGTAEILKSGIVMEPYWPLLVT